MSFGKSVGVNASVGYSEKGGYNVGAGYNSESGSGFGLSYSQKEGFGGHVSTNISGMNVGLSYSQKGGYGIDVGVKTDYGTIGLGLQLDDHGGFQGWNAKYTSPSSGTGKLSGAQTFGIGFNEDTGYNLITETKMSYGSDWRNMDFTGTTSNTFNFGKDGRFTGATTDTKMGSSYNDVRANEYKRLAKELGISDEDIQKDAEKHRAEMNWMEKAGDMIAGAWLSMNGTLGQWGRDVAGMVSNFGQSLGNLISGNGFNTNNEVAVADAMQELGRQEAVVAAFGAYDEYSKKYDTAVKGAMGEYEKMQKAFTSASDEYDKMYSEAMKGYDGYNQAVKIATDRIFNGYTMNVDQLKADALALNQGGGNGLVSELNDAIKNIKNNKGLDANSIKDSVCVTASMYIMLKNSGANVGSFSEFYADNVNKGLIRGNDAFVDQDNQAKIVSQYKIDGGEIELARTKDYSEYLNYPQGLGIVRYSLGNGGHNMNVYNQNGISYMVDTGWRTNIGNPASNIIKRYNFQYYQYIRTR